MSEVKSETAMETRQKPGMPKAVFGVLASLGLNRHLDANVPRLAAHSARSLLSQKRESLVIILALSLWTPCLLLTMGLRSGVQRQVNQVRLSVINPREGNIYYVQSDNTPDFRHRRMDLEALRKNFGGKVLFSGTGFCVTKLSGDGKPVRVALAAVEPDYDTIRGYSPIAGSLLNDQDEISAARVCVVTQTLARDLGLGVSPVGKTVFVWGVPFTVKGLRKDGPLISSTPRLTHNKDFEMPLSTALRLLFREDGPARIRFLVRPGYDVDSIANQMEQFLVSRYPNWTPGKAPLRIETGRSAAARIRSAAHPMLVTGTIIAALSFLGGFGILANVLLMYVSHRRREIGIKRALGASRGAIQAEFAATAALLCLSGMILGLLGGAVAYWFIQQGPTIRTASGLPKYPIAFTGHDLIFVLFVSLLGLIMSLGVGVRFINKLSPVEALRP